MTTHLFRTLVVGSLRRTATAVVLATVFAGVGCGEPKEKEIPGANVRSLGPPPVPPALLNATYPSNAGLLTGVTPDGNPTLPAIDGAIDGASDGATDGADPMMVETLRFYDTLKSPSWNAQPVDYPDPFTGERTAERRTAPMTLDEWKRVFGFPAREPGESISDYRERTGIAIYYNRTELGLGRQLGCARFTDGAGAGARHGVACFVTNHGAGFRQGSAALQAAIDDSDTRNTVCITYRPSMAPGYQVQFYVYGATGKRQEWARLDTLGPRPHPQVCTTCHGGAYDLDRHLVRNAHFLPLDPALVAFAEGDGVPTHLTREGQEERIRAFNAMSIETPLTSSQQAMVAALYPTGVTNSGSTATGDAVPPAWNTQAGDGDFYRAVVKPYCATCHLATKRGLQDTDVWSYALFATPAAFDAAPLDSYVCNAFSMPNAQPTSLAFWDMHDGAGITVAGQAYHTAADALLARRGLDRSSCGNLDSVAGCNRGPDPDALCGGAVSGGATCDLETGRCVPVVRRSE